jgi:desampylase
VHQRVLDQIEAHARRESPRECCGLLVGNDLAILEAVATDNAADDPLRRYAISPVDYFAQIKRCRARAERGEAVAVIGAYHSHPRHQPEPSPTDLQEAFDGFLFVIAGPVDGPIPLSIKAYRLMNGNLQPVPLVPVAQEAQP